MSAEQIIEQGEDPGLVRAQMSEEAGGSPESPASSGNTVEVGDNAGGAVVGSPTVPPPPDTVTVRREQVIGL